MTLWNALSILARAHTRDDSVVGFTVEAMPNRHFVPWSDAEYIEAWKKVREEVHLQTEPPA